MLLQSIWFSSHPHDPKLNSAYHPLSNKSNVYEKFADSKGLSEAVNPQTKQWLNGKGQKDKQWSTTQTTKNWATRNPLQTGGELTYLVYMNLLEKLFDIHVVNGL